MTDYSSQRSLFDRIRELLPPQDSLVDTVAEILNLSPDSSYRRIRNETALVLDEAKKLCDHFQLSLDQLFELKKGSVLFRKVRIHNEEYSYEKYLGGLMDLSRHISSFFRKEIIYRTKDLPIFHNFYFSPLIAFRYFFWKKSMLQDPGFRDREFELDCIPAETESLSRELARAYSEIPSVEIWNTECINSTISQIEFYKDSGLFLSAADIRAVYDALEASILHLQAQAEAGYKFLPGEEEKSKKTSFHFFYNRVVLGDTTILVTTDQARSVYLNYDVLNYITSQDEQFCNETYEDLQNLMRKSTLISQTGEKQRNVFFGILLSKIKDRRQHV